MDNKKNPWKWIPTLYFIEGLPNAIVTAMTLVLYKRMGLPNDQITAYTSLIALPWVIKPLWSPFVDLISTKRKWTLSMQFLIGLCAFSVGLSLSSSMYVGLSLTFFALMAFFSATHDIAADGYYMMELDSHSQSLFVGIRSTFYRLSTIAGTGLLVMLAGELETRCDNVAQAWQITFMVIGALFLAMSLGHTRLMPKAEKDVQTREHTPVEMVREFLKTFVTFFRKKDIIPALLFMALYRLPEALLTKVSTLFLMDDIGNGGLGLTTKQIGIANGTVGIIGLTIGGIAGGWMASRTGLKKALWPMVLMITLPDMLYVVLSMAGITDMWVICPCIFVEQFGYGFGFTAYMLYLIYFAQGESQTSHYAICTGIMALSLQLPGFIAGLLQGIVGYTSYFIIVMACCIVTYIVSALVRIDPEFGKKGT